MLRSLTLTGLFGLAAFVGAAGSATPAKADWNFFLGHHHHHHDAVYSVYYRNQSHRHGWNFFRKPGRSEWILYGTYNDERDARRAERRLERSGYEATIRESR